MAHQERGVALAFLKAPLLYSSAIGRRYDYVSFWFAECGLNRFA